MPSGCHTDLSQFRLDVLLGLIWARESGYLQRVSADDTSRQIDNSFHIKKVTKHNVYPPLNAGATVDLTPRL